jgi:membrane fusion protein, multidrug efflux system
VEQLAAQLAQAAANDRTAQLERHRSERLVAEGAISRAAADAAINGAMASEANVRALRQALAAARERVTQADTRVRAAESRLSEVATTSPREVETRQVQVGVRQATLDQIRTQFGEAQLNLSYCTISAPVAGIVGRKGVSTGDHVVPGQQLLAISQVEKLWVTANFRETQLEHLRPGQHATVHVDAIDATFSGAVESLDGATGSRFSVLPPENATGNYVKVVQRIPVRIRFDPGQPGLERLRPGMSVEPKVRLR